ncbi:MAG: alpha-ketoacid dehydrogenase subunit beta [Candidatus Tectomicrobia bacterium]|nr:alpha-ketoacid dehydrogenase subunit beta [Candidatus Tectomicrobia bacterium]
MRKITFMDALNEAIREEMERDERVFLMGEDIGRPRGAFGVTKGLFEKFGDVRVKDTPISESAIIGSAVGAAITGLRPVAEIMFIDFIGVCMDQIMNQMAKNKYMFGGKAMLPIVVRTNSGAGTKSAAQHSSSPEAILIHIPGLKVVMPSTPYDAKGLMKSSIRDNNPVIFIENRLLYRTQGEVPEEEYTIPLSVADVKREGSDVTVITWSRMTLVALSAAEMLANDGIEVEVVDLRTLKPLDTETFVKSVKKTGRAVILHEAWRTAGFGGEVAAILADEAFDYLDAPIKRVTAPDTPVPYSTPLEEFYLPNEQKLIETIRSILD